MKLSRLVPLAIVGALCLVSLTSSSCSSGDPCVKSGPQVPEGKREARGRYTVVWLHGTPYEMGYQHGRLLHDELNEAAEMLQTDPTFKIMADAAHIAKLDEIATENSYPWLLDECTGMVDAVGNPNFTMFECLLLNFGDVAVEFLQDGMPEVDDIAPGCSQVVVSGAATADGHLYHARSLDWANVKFVVEHPVIFVRHPDEGIPHVFIGFPGNLSSYQGMNAEGVAVASNEVDPRDPSVHDRTGRSHVQMVVDILTHAHDLAEARQIILSANHMTLETLVVSDAKSRSGEVFEMAPARVGVRGLEDGVVFATNHFVSPETQELDADPIGESSASRFQRFTELVPPTGKDTKYGTFDPETLVSVLRDRINPETGQESPPDAFDDNKSIATNGALYQVVFAPEDLSFWVAAGAIPVPSQPFTGFSLGALLDQQGATDPPAIP